MFTSDSIIRNAMTGAISPDDADKLLDLALRVEKSVTCPASGRILDTRTAQLATVKNQSGENVMLALDPAVDAVSFPYAPGVKFVETWRPTVELLTEALR